MYRRKRQQTPATDAAEHRVHFAPFLVIVPPSIITQWARELQRISKTLYVLLYYGDYRIESVPGTDRAKTVQSLITHDSELFDGSGKRGRTVIITTYETWRSRHGPSALAAWRKSNKLPGLPAGVCDPTWPSNLSGKFQDVILDEAHLLRNPDSSQSIAVRWLKATFYLCMSATILFNSINDFKGYIDLIIPGDSECDWSKDSLDRLGVGPNVNPFSLESSHPGVVLQMTRGAIMRHIFNKNVTTTVAGARIRKLFAQMMIRRTLTSIMTINGRSFMIGESIPPSHSTVINCRFTVDERSLYTHLCASHYRGLITIVNDRYIFNMRKYRMLTLLTSWLGFEFVEETATAANWENTIRALRLKGLARQWEKEIVQRHAVHGKQDIKAFFRSIRRAGRQTQPRVQTLRILLRGSPKMRQMLPLISHQVLVEKQKAIVWCAFPATQAYVAACLLEGGIDTRVFHSGLTNSDRHVLVDQFTKETITCMVLVCSLSVNAHGLNLHALCSICHLFDLAFSDSVRDQAIGRLRRLGQQNIVQVFEYRVINSFNTRQISNSTNKATAGIIADLNPEMFNVTVENDEDVNLGRWIIRNGQLTRLADVEELQEGDSVDEVEIVQNLIETMKGAC
jgi:SNF2 family DNA or RNA helicase